MIGLGIKCLWPPRVGGAQRCLGLGQVGCCVYDVLCSSQGMETVLCQDVLPEGLVDLGPQVMLITKK